MYQKGFANIILIISLLIMGVGLIFLFRRTTPQPSKHLSATPTIKPVVIIKSELDTSKLKTYKNVQFNLSFQYPQTWVLKEATNKEIVLPLDIYINPPNQNSQTPLLTLSGELVDDNIKSFVGNESFTKMIIGKNSDITAYKDNGEGPYRTDSTQKEYKYYILNDNRVIVLSYAPNEVNSYQIEVDQILSTFKFNN